MVKQNWLKKIKYVPVPVLIKRADTIFSKFKRLSALMPAGYIRCFTCGGFISYRETDCGHYVGREYMSTRFLEENTAPQCRSCNRFGEGMKSTFAVKLQAKYGPGILEHLEALRQTQKFFTAPELEELIKFYKAKVKELEIEKDWN